MIMMRVKWKEHISFPTYTQDEMSMLGKLVQDQKILSEILKA